MRLGRKKKEIDQFSEKLSRHWMHWRQEQRFPWKKKWMTACGEKNIGPLQEIAGNLE